MSGHQGNRESHGAPPSGGASGGVPERTYKSPVIAQAVTECIDRWLTQQDANNVLTYHTDGGYTNTYVDGPVDLDALGKHVAAQLGF